MELGSGGADRVPQAGAAGRDGGELEESELAVSSTLLGVFWWGSLEAIRSHVAHLCFSAASSHPQGN